VIRIAGEGSLKFVLHPMPAFRQQARPSFQGCMVVNLIEFFGHFFG
jgi:hypothetical protein